MYSFSVEDKQGRNYHVEKADYWKKIAQKAESVSQSRELGKKCHALCMFLNARPNKVKMFLKRDYQNFLQSFVKLLHLLIVFCLGSFCFYCFYFCCTPIRYSGNLFTLVSFQLAFGILFANSAFTVYLMKLSWPQIDIVECLGKFGCFKEDRKCVRSRCRIDKFYFNHFHFPVCSFRSWKFVQLT